MSDEKKTSVVSKAAASGAAQAQASSNGGKKKVGYFKGVRTEMKKVVWPSRQDTLSYTVAVVVICAIITLLFWGFDTGFLALLKAALNITV